VPRVKLVVSYDGRAYRGSQVQPNVPTVQDALEKALREIRAYAGATTFAGRTDAGVHALGQVVSCDVHWDAEPQRLGHALNGVLPSDIRVMRCERAEPEFNARFDAVSREYRYRVADTPRLSPLHAGIIWAHSGPLDPELAAEAAGKFMGRHSFGSFASAGFSQRLDAEGLERQVINCCWTSIDSPLVALLESDCLYELRIVAEGFLPQMVRNITSAVVDVASGKQRPEWIEYLLVSGDRRLLGPPAPPHGLILWNVEYAGNLDATTGNEG